ncbi:MAG: hypothetical protein K1X72_26140 [Pyrinomonadaceae bacterium]|nr:hypothetical protein [Pyrinomonadaceae bacterium]
MKITLTIFLSSILFLSSCSLSPQNSTNSINNPSKGKIISLKGEVVEIYRGKDGYTAKIKTDDDKVHSATISSIELGSRYKETKVGETIDVEGEDTLGDGTMVRVTVLR